MASELRLRRGSAAAHEVFTGAPGEVTFDTTKNVLVAHDGATPGGHPAVAAERLASGSGAGDVGIDPTLGTVAGSVGAKFVGTVIPSDAPWFADRTGATPAGAAINACMDWAIANRYQVDFSGGLWGISPDDIVSLNGSIVGDANQQWDSVLAIKGNGRGFNQCIFKALAGDWPDDLPVVRGRNMSGRVIKQFTIDTAGHATRAADFAWLGGSQGNPALAPSSQNVLCDLMVLGGSLDLTQFHDSPIERILVRDVPHGQPAVILNGPGGMVMFGKSYVGSGVFQVACQNASIQDSGFFGGVELMGLAFNTIAWTGCHFYPNPVNGLTINSTAGGNASRYQVFNSCYFNPTGAAGDQYVVAGRYWQGARFIGGQATGYTDFFGDISPAAGAGSLPVFHFEGFSFGGPVPVSKPGHYWVDIENCQSPGGDIFSVRLPDVTQHKIRTGLNRIKRDFFYDLAATDGTWYPIISDEPLYRGTGRVMICGSTNDQPVANASFGRAGTNAEANQFATHISSPSSTGAAIEFRWEANSVPELRIVGMSTILQISAEYILM